MSAGYVTRAQADEIVRLRHTGLTFRQIGDRMERAASGVCNIYKGHIAGRRRFRHETRARMMVEIERAVEAGATKPRHIAAAIGSDGQTVSDLLWHMGFDRQEREECARAFARDRARHGSDTRRPAAAEPVHGPI